MITKALAGSLLVAASMSANSTTQPVTVTFGVLPALTVTTITGFAPGAVLTGGAASTCTWTPTLAGANDPAVSTDVNVVRSGTGCPDLASAAGAATNTGVYVVSAGATGVSLDVNIEVQTGTSADTNLTFAPTAIAIPDDSSTPQVNLVADAAQAVNTGASGDINLYLGGTSTVVNAFSADTDVTFNIVATY